MDGDRESSLALAVELLFKRGDGFRHARERERDREGGLRLAEGSHQPGVVPAPFVGTTPVQARSRRLGDDQCDGDQEFPSMLRPIDLDPLMPYPPMVRKDVPKSLILATSTGAEKTSVNTAQIFVGDRAGIYCLKDGGMPRSLTQEHGRG